MEAVTVEIDENLAGDFRRQTLAEIVSDAIVTTVELNRIDPSATLCGAHFVTVDGSCPRSSIDQIGGLGFDDGVNTDRQVLKLVVAIGQRKGGRDDGSSFIDQIDAHAFQWLGTGRVGREARKAGQAQAHMS